MKFPRLGRLTTKRRGPGIKLPAGPPKAVLVRPLRETSDEMRDTWEPNRSVPTLLRVVR